MSDRPARSLNTEILALAIPALGALAADPLLFLADTAFVAQLGELSLAALGVNASVFALAFVVFNFLAYGSTPLISDALGRGARKEAGRLVVQSGTLALLLGVSMALTLWVATGPILALMGTEGPLEEAARSYLVVRAGSAPAALLVIAGHGVFRGFSDTRTPLLITVVINLINLIMDPVLMFGLDWGLAGAAWASALAQWAGAVLFVGALARRRSDWAIDTRIPTPKELRPLLRVGGVLTVRTFALIGTMTVATAVATRLGTASVAAHQVAIQIWGALALLIDALAVAGQILVARYLGSGDSLMARRVADRLVLWGVGGGVFIGAALYAATPLVPLVFGASDTVLALVMPLMPVVVLMQPINAAVFVWDGVYLGAKRFKLVAMIMVGAASVALVVLALVQPMGWGLWGVWAGMVTFMVGRFVAMGYGHLRGTFIQASDE